MTFPVVFNPFGYSLHAHVLFETLGYVIGFQTFLFLRRRRAFETVNVDSQLWLFVGCVFGAFAVSKGLAWVESWPDYWAARDNPAVWLGGKTIVGGLIGGWLGVEIAKFFTGVRTRTGDGYVIPLCLGIAIGRIGCFLTGLADHTHGVATSLPWGVDFGDGIRRHPTQLYEFLFLLAMAGIFARSGVGWRRDTGGRAFRIFLIGYLQFRFAIEFIKPSWKGYAHLSAIQWASLITAGAAAWQIKTTKNFPPSSSTAAVGREGEWSRSAS